MDFGLLLLRLVVGLTLAAHGAQKLFGWFGGPGIEGTAGGMESLGFVPGKRAAVMAGLAETVAGMLLAAGAATPFAAAILVGVMLVAIVSVHLEHGFFVTGGGYEYPLVLGVSAATLAFTGPGRLSVDAWFGIHSAGMLWGTGALLVGIFGATVQLASRGRTATAHTRA
jgi:putative oxidoreductase